MQRLYTELQSDDFDVREYAMFQLALMLRRAKDLPAAADWLTSEQLARDLRRIRLSPADQQQIVSRLLRLAARQPGSWASAFWVLGEVSATVAFSQALAAIGEYGDQFSDEAIIQACTALQAWLASDDCDQGMVDDLLAAGAPSQPLWRWASSSKARAAACANAVISRARQLQQQ